MLEFESGEDWIMENLLETKFSAWKIVISLIESSTIIIILKGATLNKIHTFLEIQVLQWFGRQREVEQEGGNQDARGFYGGWRDGGHSRKDVCWVDFNGMTRSEQNFERDYGVRQVDIWQKRF